eukprot:scaffold4496_cov123-Skeletonema_dohrnii-CCMP3373.AAC.1
MANYHGSLEAVDCHSHSVRYDMAVNREAGGHLRFLIIDRYDMVARVLLAAIPNLTSSGHEAVA